MKKIFLVCIGLFLLQGCAGLSQNAGAPKVYNETFNPRQKEYPNHLGFNDLHIQAIRHIEPDTHDVHDPKL
jgi:hypothetical protein